MTKRLSVPLVLGVVLSLVLAACGSPKEKDPVGKLLAHTDAMIRLLEEHRADPDEATRELAAYQQKHGAEIEELQRRLADLMQKDPMKSAAAASAYGMRSAQLAGLTAEITARARAE